MRPFHYLKPSTTAAALTPASTGQSMYIGGGTNLVDLMKKHIAKPETLVDVATAVPAHVMRDKKGLRLGAFAKNSAVADDAQVLQHFPLLAKAILAGASPQIRNMATTGGNLLQRTRCPYFYESTAPCNKRTPGSGCSAIEGDNRMSAVVGYSTACVATHPSDFCVGLAALDAVVEIQEANGKRRSIPFADFHRLPGDMPELDTVLPKGALITEVRVPANAFAQHSAYVKIRDRDSYAFALISVAAALDMKGGTIRAARLASGGVAHKPWRWLAAEQFLKGKSATPDNFRQAAALVEQAIKPLSENGYKGPMLRGAIETALQNCLSA